MINILVLMRNKVLPVLAISALVTLSACTSNGPATSFYSLFSDRSVEPITHTMGSVSIGLGPVVLPDYLDNPAIVSLTEGHKVRVSGYHAWAGSLKESMTRVLADDISAALKLDTVWGFPWDNRVRPDYQLRIVVEQFDGVRGAELSLRAKWTLLNKSADKILAVGSVALSEQANGRGVNAYVAGLNRLLNRMSISIVEELSEKIKN